jgi:2-aminoadipate transaminase
MNGVDFASLFAEPAPAPAPAWAGFPRYNFVGGHNDPEGIPVDELAAAAGRAILARGRALATYNTDAGPLGDPSLRHFIAGHLASHSGTSFTQDDILITAGSWQGIQLLAELLVGPGDTVLVEEHSFQDHIDLVRARGARVVAVPMDREGIRIDALAAILEDLSARDVAAKYVYTIPTLQNPTGTVLPLSRRRELLALCAGHGVAIFEDDCYADLLPGGERPPALLGLDRDRNVLYAGSFSKCLAPALRLGYLVAPPEVLPRLITLKGKAGTGALEQMVAGEFLSGHFADHVESLRHGLRDKLQAMVSALDEHFGTAAECDVPRGGMFLWVRLPAEIDTRKLLAPAAEAGIAFNDGSSWSVDGDAARHCLRLCFALPSVADIDEGIARLAEICHRETGIPPRGGNIER